MTKPDQNQNDGVAMEVNTSSVMIESTQSEKYERPNKHWEDDGAYSDDLID